MMIVSLISYCSKKVHYRRLFLCHHTQQIHSVLNYIQRLYVVLGRLIALITVTHSVNQQLLLHQHAGETCACWLS